MINPARDLKDALRRPEPQHFQAITDPKRFGELLRASDAYAATPAVRAALTLVIVSAFQISDLRNMHVGFKALEAAHGLLPG